MLPQDAPDAEVWREQDGTACAYGYSAAGHHWVHLPGLATYRFNNASPEVTAFPEPSDFRELILDGFQRTVLPLALQARGHEVLHASAVRTAAGVVSFCAVAGTGKSSIAYGLHLRGYPLWADDAVAFGKSGRQVTALPLPFQIRLRPASAAFFGNPPPTGCDGSGAGSLPLAAVCVLERAADPGAGNPAEIGSLHAGAAFTQALTHAYCFDLRNLERKRQMIEHYFDLVETVPILKVCFRPGLDNLPAILDCIERAVQPPRSR